MSEDPHVRELPYPRNIVIVHNKKQLCCVLEVFFKEGITKCSNEVYNKINNIRQRNKYLLEHIGYMFRLVNRSKHVSYFGGGGGGQTYSVYMKWQQQILLYIQIFILCIFK